MFVRPACLALIALISLSATALATPELIIEASSGQVIHARDATARWYPASLTKLMTAYVVLRSVAERRLSLQDIVPMSARAAAAAPSKLGLRVGQALTVDGALKVLLVKSANDVAIALAERTSGSVGAFVTAMNAHSRRIGLRGSRWVNPNGLHDPRQITTARDMAKLMQRLIAEFPDQASLLGIPAVAFAGRVMENHSGLIGRYPAVWAKTGYVCASGFNVVASLERQGRRIIAVVMGRPSAIERDAWAALLMETAFQSQGSGGLDALPPSAEPAMDLRRHACGRKLPDETTDAERAWMSAFQAVPKPPAIPILVGLASSPAPVVAAPTRIPMQAAEVVPLPLADQAVAAPSALSPSRRPPLSESEPAPRKRF
jgi:D-alanyl-D-alanine carboxypeptidase